MSSKYTTINFPIKGHNTCVITLIKVLGALDKANDIIIHSYSPSFVLNVVFYSSPERIRIWWQLLFKSIFEKIVAPDIMSSISSSLRIGQRYFTVILLIARLSTHIRLVPSFFGINSAEIARGSNSRINPLLNKPL